MNARYQESLRQLAKELGKPVDQLSELAESFVQTEFRQSEDAAQLRKSGDF